MKKLVTILAFFAAFTANAQHAYISTNGRIILYSGSIEQYDTPDIYVDASYNTLLSTWTATLQITTTGATTGFVKIYQIELSNATVDAITVAGGETTNVGKAQNCVLQAVKAYLLALNGAITFTLH